MITNKLCVDITQNKSSIKKKEWFYLKRRLTQLSTLDNLLFLNLSEGKNYF